MKVFLIAACLVGSLVFARPPKGGDGSKDGDEDPAVKAFTELIKLCFDKAMEAADDDKRSFDDIFDGPFRPVCERVLAELEKLESDDDTPNPSGPPPSGKPNMLRKLGGKKGKKEGENKGDRPTGPPPSGAPQKDGDGKKFKGGKDDRRLKGGDRPTGNPPTGDYGGKEGKKGGMEKGDRPTGPPPSGAPRKEWDGKKFKGGKDDRGLKGGDRPTGNPPTGDYGGKEGKKGGMEKGDRPTGPPPSGAPRKEWDGKKFKGGKDERGLKGGDKADKPDDARRLLGICKAFAAFAEQQEKRAFDETFVKEVLEGMEVVCDLALLEIEALKADD